MLLKQRSARSINKHSAVGFPVLHTSTVKLSQQLTTGTLTDKFIGSNISNTRDRVSSGYPNTERRVENTTRRYFPNALIIHQVKTKITTSVKGWIPGLNQHRFLRSYFSVYSLVFVLTEKIYQTLETMFHRLSKHLEFRQKYSAARGILNSLLSVWISR